MKSMKEYFKKGYRFVCQSNLLLIVLLLIISLSFPILILDKIRFNRLPVGADTGGELSTSYAIFENNYPMWDVNPLQNLSLLYFIIYPLAKILGEVWAMNMIGLSLLTIRPLAVYFFINKMFKNRFLALLGASADAFFPSYYEMYSFGGYANLFGFIVLPIVFFYILQNGQSVSLKNFLISLAFSTVVILSHNLTSIIFIETVCLWLLPKLFKRQYKLVLQCLLAVVLPLIIYRLVVGGVSDFVFVNEFAYYSTAVTKGWLLYIFKDLVLLISLIILSAVGIFEFSRVNRDGAVLLVSWLLSPILYYICSYSTRFMIIDYTRLWFFLVQPLIISTVFSLKTLWERKNKLFALSFACILVSSCFNFGYITQDSRIPKYGDTNSYNLIMWIKENLSEKSTVVVRAPIIGRLINGFAHIRTTGVTKLSFIRGQYERSLASDSILSCNIMGYSDMFKIQDQTPILFLKTPYIYIFADGNYKALGYFQDSYPLELKKLITNVTEISFDNNTYTIKYDEYYPAIEIVKKVGIDDDEVWVNYKFFGKGQVKSLANMILVNYFWFPPSKDWKFENDTLITDYGNVKVVTNAISVQKEYVSIWGRWRLVFSFNDELSVTFRVKDIRMVKGNTILTTSDDLIKQYGVTHALIRVDDTQSMEWAESKWELLYNNSLFYLYKVTKTELGGS